MRSAAPFRPTAQTFARPLCNRLAYKVLGDRPIHRAFNLGMFSPRTKLMVPHGCLFCESLSSMILDGREGKLRNQRWPDFRVRYRFNGKGLAFVGC